MHRTMVHLMHSGRALLAAAGLALLTAAGCNLDYVGVPTPPALVSGGAPVVTIAAPQADAIYMPGVDVIVQARISNAGPDVARVEAAVNGAAILNLDNPNPGGAYAFSVQTRWQASVPGPHSLTVVAVREDGTRSAPVTLTFRVAGEASPGSATMTTTPASATPIPPSATSVQVTLAPTSASTDAPASGVTLTGTINQTLNVRSGPGLAFNPPIGSFTAGQSAELLARSPAGDWYKVRYLNGVGWVFAALVTVAGDPARLPVDAGPAAPTPTTARATLPLPPTNAPRTTANLVAGLVVLTPGMPDCAQPFVVSLDVTNVGSEPTSASGAVALTDARSTDGSVQQTTTGSFPVLQPGETFRVDMPLTVSTYYDELHRITLDIDPANQVNEAQDGDNAQTIDYVLQKGGCP